MKNTILNRMMTAFLVIGIAACTYFIVKNPSALHEEVKTQQVRFLNQLATKLVTERVAEFEVEQIGNPRNPDAGFCKLKWRERIDIRDDQSERFGPPRYIEIAGVRPRFEVLIIEFDDTDAPESLAVGSGRIILFRRAYGENTAPNEGFSFADFSNPVPLIYAVHDKPNAQERETWRRFWRLATDPESAKKEGLRIRSVAYSVARTLKAKCRYRVTAEAGGRLGITLIDS